MKKALYCLIIIAISLPVLSYGMKAEQDSLLVNGVAVLEIIVPTFTFLLTQIFILLFDKEDQPLIIIGSSLLISGLGNLITIGYYHIDLTSISDGRGALTLFLSAILIAMLTLISLRLYTSAESFFSDYPKHKTKL